jgi:hypothetical protein
MKLANLQSNPMVASMVGLDTKVFYQKEKNRKVVEARIYESPELRFGNTPTYRIEILSDSDHHKKGDRVVANRSQLYLDEESSKRALEGFMVLGD